MLRFLHSILVALVLFVFASCGGNKKSVPTAPTYHPFPSPKAPAMIQEPQARVRHLAKLYWNDYLSTPGITDSAAISSVKNADVEMAFSTYLALLDMLPFEESCALIDDLFQKVEQKQASDSLSLFYLRFTELVSRYLYDPNSPVRNEDYYLPFVEGMAKSRFTSEDLRPAYIYEAQMCSLNRYGEQVPNFYFKDIKERLHNLYEIKSEYTLLLFSNPGCHNCLEIKEQIEAVTEIDTWIAQGRLAIVNIYIDQELAEWREYEPNYPRSWISGYDHNYIIREDLLYNVRAIPSLYLLDSEKRVILKDPPSEKAIEYIISKLNKTQ